MTRLTAQTGSLAGRTAWVISDGKAGHESQCLGVVEALRLTPEIKRVCPTGVYKWAAPWGPVAPRERFGRPGSPFEPPWPSLAFATGRTTIPYIRALRRNAGIATYTVILMDPRTGSGSADLIWVPEHDRRRGSNVITTLAAPHRFSPSRLAALRSHIPSGIAALPSPRVACLIGGPNGDYRYTPGDEARLLRNLDALAASGAGLMITPSRRTPARLRERINTMTRGAALVWDGKGDNPYPDFLAHADHFFITADSVSMTCEAAATGRPIHIFSPTGGSAKFDRFHAGLQTYGATRPLGPEVTALETWSYEPIDAAEVIGGEITRRWRRRAALLPGLVSDVRPG